MRSHETIERALRALANLEHRGAAGADADTGDGAGILVQMPDAFFRGVVRSSCRRPARYGVGRLLPAAGPPRAAELEELLEQTVVAEGQRVLGWRDVPVDAAPRRAARRARSRRVIRQLFVGAADELDDATRSSASST